MRVLRFLFALFLVPIMTPLLVPSARAVAPAPVPADWHPAQLGRSLSFEMDSRFTGRRYRILIGLPHTAAPAGGYPVLWALDGLASFPLMTVARPRPPAPGDSAEWRRKVGDEPAGLIVAVGHASGLPFDVDARAADYTPRVDVPSGDRFSTEHGGAEAFLRFLTEELRPLIAHHFALDPQRNTVFGFSYGGLFALHALSTSPQHFQRYWAASPSLWFGQDATLDALPGRLAGLDFSRTPVRLTLSVGTDEQYPASFPSAQRRAHVQSRHMVDNAKRFTERLRAAGADVRYIELADHDHLDMLMHGARHVMAFAFAP